MFELFLTAYMSGVVTTEEFIAMCEVCGYGGDCTHMNRERAW